MQFSFTFDCFLFEFTFISIITFGDYIFRIGDINTMEIP